jgi:acetyl-CoA carboxylase carboxyl transferase subunit alpha
VKVPMISVVIGEGGSGGAIALATANKVLMLQYSVHSR